MIGNNKKGQALVEFVFILPIILLLMLVFVDIGRFFYTKIQVESVMMDLVREVEKGINNVSNFEDELNKEKITITLEDKYDGDTIKLKLTKEITFITPGMEMFFENPYLIEKERVVSYD